MAMKMGEIVNSNVLSKTVKNLPFQEFTKLLADDTLSVQDERDLIKIV
jgi:hypothetical protein